MAEPTLLNEVVELVREGIAQPRLLWQLAVVAAVKRRRDRAAEAERLAAEEARLAASARDSLPPDDDRQGH